MYENIKQSIGDFSEQLRPGSDLGVRIYAHGMADDLLSSIHAYARQKNLGSSAIIKNLIADSNLNDLGILFVLIKYWRTTKSIDLGDAVYKIIDRDFHKIEPPKILHWLLLGGRSPSKKKFREFAGEDVKLYYQLRMSRWSAPSLKTTDEHISILNDLFLIFRCGIEDILSDADYFMQWPKLSGSDLNGLNTELQKLILSSKKLCESVLTEEALNFLSKNPYRYRFSGQSLALQEFILKSLIPFLRAHQKGSNVELKCDCGKDLPRLIDHIYESDFFYGQLTTAFPEFDLSQDQLMSILELSTIYDSQKLKYLSRLNPESRSAVFEAMSITMWAIAYKACKDDGILRPFLNKKYLTEEFRRELLVPHVGTSLCGNKLLWNELSDDIFDEVGSDKIYSYESLFKIILYYANSDDLRRFLLLRKKTGVFYWVSELLKGKNRRLFRKIVLEHARDLKEFLFEAEAQYKLKQKGFKLLLRKVLAGKLSPGVLGLRQECYPYLVTYVKKAYAEYPVKAAAYELALRVSIRDAQYLYYLCALRRNQMDLHKPGHVFDDLYYTYKLPKKSGGNRLITAPEQRLKQLQRRILNQGIKPVNVHDCAHGFLVGRSILTNAKIHVGRSCVVNVDIQAFFPNTSYKLILKACAQLFNGQMSAPAKYALADICSFSGGLPMGAPTSPGLANIVLKSADQSISKACTKFGINYSRYADDLTFSSDGHPVKIIPFVKKVLGGIGYNLDQKKTNIFRRGRRQVVTGLVVNVKANLPRRIRKRLRAAVHRRSLNKNIHWQGKPMSEDCLVGHLNWLHLVQPDEARRYKKILTKT